MRRTRLSWLLTVFWLASFGLAWLAMRLLEPGAMLYVALGLCAGLPSVAGWVIARSEDARERKALAALGEATGTSALGAEASLVYTREIIANLCGRLERARTYQSAFEQSSQPALIVDETGAIIKMSAGIAQRAPECAETETVAALLGKDVPRVEKPMAGLVHFAGYDWRAASVPLGQDRWLVALDRPGTVLSPGDWHAMTEALAGGDTGFRFGADRLAANPDLEAINLGFEALDESAKALDALARDGERADILPRNGGLAPQIEALSQTIASLAQARNSEAEASKNALARLEKIGVLVDLCRKSAGELTLAAQEARLAADNAREAMHTGAQSASVLTDTQKGMRGRTGSASEAARRASQSVVGVQNLTREIDALVAGIEDVSFRTNLLALNAAVEAARAGEKGAGFAVVAAEVRELAQASSKNSKTIRALVGKSLVEAGEGTAQAQALISALTDIDAHLLNLSDETARIEGALTESGKSLGLVEDQLGVMSQTAQAQEQAFLDRGAAIEPRDGSKARRV